MAAPVSGNHPTAFTFQDIEGGVWIGEEMLGGVVLLFFTATWCEPCRVAEEALQDLFSSYGDRAAFLGVFLPPNNGPGGLEFHRQAMGTSWPIGPDQDSMQERFAVATVPAVFVLRYDGSVGLDWSPVSAFSEEIARLDIGSALERSIAEVPWVPPDFLWGAPLVGSMLGAGTVVLLLRRKTREPSPRKAH